MQKFNLLIMLIGDLGWSNKQ